MTRKDYIRIAGAIRAVRESYSPSWNPNLFRALDDATLALAGTLAEDNPRFDRERFATAAGVRPELANGIWQAPSVPYTTDHSRVG